MKLVLKHIEEHAVSVVESGLTITEALVRHSAHIEVFDTYKIVLIGYLRRLLMKEVLALIGDMTMFFCDLHARFAIVVAAFVFVTKFSLCFGQTVLTLAIMLRGSTDIAVRTDIKTVGFVVKTNGIMLRMQNSYYIFVIFKEDGAEKLAVM